MSHLYDIQHLFAASSGLALLGSLGSPWLLCQRGAPPGLPRQSSRDGACLPQLWRRSCCCCSCWRLTWAVGTETAHHLHIHTEKYKSQLLD